MKRVVYLLLGFIILSFSPVQAQEQLTATRSFVPSPGSLGMGDAVVALPMQQSAFFYNPAHAAHSKFHLTVVGVRVAASNTLPDQISFFRDELQPAIDEGIENLESGRLKSLYDETLAIGRKSTFLNADVLAPSVGFHAGSVGLAFGIFGSSTTSYRFPDGGGGLPLVKVTAMADAMAVGSAGINLSKFGVSGLSVGLTGKYTQRYVVFKNKPLDAISDNEPLDLLSANRASVDLGFMYELPFLNRLPGKFQAGLAIYDIAGSGFAFSHEGTLQGESELATVNQDIALANEYFKVEPSFRLGVGYTLPKLPGGLLDETGVSIDYVGTQNPNLDQALFAHLHIGAQARVKFFSLRAGLNQGYPTIGGGLSLGFMDLDYAYYGVENGRYPGQLPSWLHAAQIRFGI